MVFYRKYRPQKIADLDNATVRERLTAALSGENIPHAFLFTGPKGLGKTSTARIVAKAMNCERKNQESGIRNQGKEQKKKEEKSHNSSFMIHDSQGVEPCNECDQCKSITNGTNLDVLEIDGASNRGIDEIRSLQEKIGLAPFGASKKVYIIDEVHMLTSEAFNALLKTLEEPPSHALFILCTTESHKVPATIVSRCFQISFSRATVEELIRSFRRVLQRESLEADDESLEVIARLSDGSFRDGAKALEEVVSLAKKGKITKELVEEKHHMAHIADSISRMVGILEKKDTKAGLELIGRLVEQGIDIKYFIEQLLNALHEELLICVGVQKEESIIHDSKFMIQEIKKLVELLTKAHGEIKYAVLPQLPLELVIIEWCFVGGAEVANENFLVAHAKEQETKTSRLEPANSHNENFVGSPRQKSPSVTGVKGESEDRNFWFAFLDAVKKESHTIAGVLRGCHLVRYDNTEVVIETRHSFHKNKLEEKNTKEILEKVCKEIVGTSIKVSIVLKDKIISNS